MYHEMNEEQWDAVTSTEGYVRVIAGAGSGKTSTMTCRIAYLIREMDVHPYHILAVTFTNNATAEMKDRKGILGSVMGSKNMVFRRRVTGLSLSALEMICRLNSRFPALLLIRM